MVRQVLEQVLHLVALYQMSIPLPDRPIILYNGQSITGEIMWEKNDILRVTLFTTFYLSDEY